MKACFIKLNGIDETEDKTVTVNADNISSIRRINYNDVVQTMITMMGGERIGVEETPQDILDMVEKAMKKDPVYN